MLWNILATEITVNSIAWLVLLCVHRKLYYSTALNLTPSHVYCHSFPGVELLPDACRSMTCTKYLMATMSPQILNSRSDMLKP